MKKNTKSLLKKIILVVVILMILTTFVYIFSLINNYFRSDLSLLSGSVSPGMTFNIPKGETKFIISETDNEWIGLKYNGITNDQFMLSSENSASTYYSILDREIIYSATMSLHKQNYQFELIKVNPDLIELKYLGNYIN